MAKEVVMPQMGESIAEGTITTWLKKVGDQVARDEPLFEISTDKVDAEIPSPFTGVLQEIKVPAGQVVPIHSVVALIAEPTGSTSPVDEAKATPAASVSAPLPAKTLPQEASAHKPAANPQAPQKSSPVVRKMAAEHGVDIHALQGSGVSGRVTKQDMVAYLEQHPQGAAIANPAPVTAPIVATGSQDIPEAYRPKIFEGDKVESQTAMRVKIAEHMVISKRVSPHVGTVWEIDFGHVTSLRHQYKAIWQERHGVNLTFTAFIMKAAVDALKAFPVLNASLDGNQVIYHRDVHLGLAVALDWGLLVPVVHNAGELNTLGLARRAADLANRARQKKLKPDEVARGTFTITNPGNYGAMFNIPVINQPQVAILGVGSIEKRPVVIDDMIAIRSRAYLSLSFDHRLIDGAVADQFMLRIKKAIEEFDAAELA